MTDDDPTTLATTEQLKKLSQSKAREMISGLLPMTTEESIARMEAITITNDEEEEFFGALLREIKSHWHNLEEQRTSITGPMNRALRAVNDLFRPVSKALETEEVILKRKLAAYADAKARAYQASVQVVADASTPEAALTAMAQVAPPTSGPEGISIRKVWKFEVVDPNLVPREYCSPDADKISAALSSGVQIPGVRIYEDSIVSARR